MRILLFTTASAFTPDVQMLMHLVVALGARGEVAGVACVQGSATAESVAAHWPRLTLRTFGAAGTTRPGSGARGVISALRPDVVLVGSARDAALAAAALGRRGGVVRRVAFGESPGSGRGPRGWRLGLGTVARIIEWGQRAPVVSWPLPASGDARGGASGVFDASDALDARDAANPELLVLPPLRGRDSPYDTSTAMALRTIAHLGRRHHTLRLTLLGDVEMLQSARVHAASLGLTGRLHVRPVQALLDGQFPDATALWVTAADDAAAMCVVAGLQHGVPAVVPHDAAFAGLIVPGASGFLATKPEFSVTLPGSPAQHPPLPVSLVTELARLIGDRFVRRVMGEAAIGRAVREYGWERFVEEARAQLLRAAGGSDGREEREPNRQHARDGHGEPLAMEPRP